MPSWTQQDYEKWLAKQSPAVMAELLSQVTKPNRVETLERPPQRAPSRRARLAGRRKPVLRIGILAVVNRFHDEDNIIAAQKGLRDAISRYFGIDDADTEIDWSYAQVVWRGQ